MKGLRKYLTPFAPDQSGAVSVLYELGGLIVIVDAGGCAGNICGFDEPRWSEKRSAVFSAGLRDMDAIMGRDKLLIKKIKDCSEKIEANFIALIGTPVPAVIGTDYHALKRVLQKETSLPVITVDSDGMHLFDSGEEKAYLGLLNALYEKDMFSEETDENEGAVKVNSSKQSVETLSFEAGSVNGTVGIFGATPLDLYSDEGKKIISSELKNKGYSDIIFYGNGASFSDCHKMNRNALNIAVSPSGLSAVKELSKYFGTPYEVYFPGVSVLLNAHQSLIRNARKILIVHSQIFSNSLRDAIRKINKEADVVVSSFFTVLKEYSEEGDVSLKEEDDFISLAAEGFDLIIGDEVLLKMLKDYSGKFISIPEFSISGKKKA